MPYWIAKTFDFDAAHSLPLMPDGHKCKRLHGHTYRVEVILCGELDARYMVADYADIADAWEPIHAVLDHHNLDSVPELRGRSTTESVAWFILREFRKGPLPVVSVRVYESATTWAQAWAPALEPRPWDDGVPAESKHAVRELDAEGKS